MFRVAHLLNQSFDRFLATSFSQTKVCLPCGLCHDVGKRTVRTDAASKKVSDFIMLEAKSMPLVGSSACVVERHGLQATKQRLDEVCSDRFPELGAQVLASWIAQGKVTVNERVVNKAGTKISPDAAIEVNAKLEKYVCR